MIRYRRATALSVLAFAGSPMITGQGWAQDVRCHRNEMVRQVEVQFAQDGDGLPCQVLWQNTAGSDQRKLVWRSASRLDFCTEKARELVHQLLDGGWTCDAQVTASPDPSVPQVTVRLESAEPEVDAALPLRSEPGPPEQAEALVGRGQEQLPPPPRAVLETALERDIGRLGQLSGRSPGSFEVSTARLGDLDGDGSVDAVALLTHRPDGAPPSHHLLAYLFDGQTFLPVARLALSETEADLTQAEFQDIVDGVIALVLHVPQPGDPECCPTGRRRLEFVLRDHELVVAGQNRPGAYGG